MKTSHESDTGRSRLFRIKDETAGSKEKRLLPGRMIPPNDCFHREFAVSLVDQLRICNAAAATMGA
jgi:hypothetical protein